MRKNLLFIIFIVIIFGIGVAGYEYWYKIERLVFRENNTCKIYPGLERYIYDDSLWSADPFFLLQFNMPLELFPEAANRGGVSKSVSELLELPIIHSKKTFLEGQFILWLKFFPSTTARVRDYIDLSLQNAIEYANFPQNQVAITQITRADELNHLGGETVCIKKFLENVDEVVLVEPTSSEGYDYFELDGLWHQPAGDDQQDGISSPFGIYAGKYINGEALVLQFSWAKNRGSFFRNKPYSVFDVLWSIRFGVIR